MLREKAGKDVLIRVLPTLYDTRTKLAREVLSELRAKFREYLMESTVNFNTKLKEAASFGQPITEYDPGSRGYKDFVNLARELMGHRPVDIEPVTMEKLSRPQELVQRAKQLAQLTNYQFGRHTVTPSHPAPAAGPTGAVGAPAPAFASAAPSGVALWTKQAATGGTAVATAPAATSAAVATVAASATRSGPASLSVKTTNQKIEEFYGVKQYGDAVVFAAKFDAARQVLIAGDFNNWTPESTPMENKGRPGEWTMKLPLRPGRYRYRFIVDGRWVTDPHNQYVETNQFGELNNVVEVN
jgi:hypothetical protein